MAEGSRRGPLIEPAILRHQATGVLRGSPHAAVPAPEVSVPRSSPHRAAVNRRRDEGTAIARAVTRRDRQDDALPLRREQRMGPGRDARSHRCPLEFSSGQAQHRRGFPTRGFSASTATMRALKRSNDLIDAIDAEYTLIQQRLDPAIWWRLQTRRWRSFVNEGPGCS